MSWIGRGGGGGRCCELYLEGCGSGLWVFVLVGVCVKEGGREVERNVDEDEEEERMVEGDIEMARQVFQRGYKDLKDRSLKEEVCYISITPKL